MFSNRFSVVGNQSDSIVKMRTELHDLDTLEKQRILWEMQHVKDFLDASGVSADARVNLRTQSIQEQANN